MIQHEILHLKKHASVLRSPSSKVSSLCWIFISNSIHSFSAQNIWRDFHCSDCATWKNISYPDDLSYCASSFYVREAGSSYTIEQTLMRTRKSTGGLTHEREITDKHIC
ncbi:hypothetical protein AVEN_217449-1 [Araneus ventricosus]|uniref:Uncharacterized protein n=1 Tax=Araneus ventricosus TaxID=182803 RepID=A0A4Y2NLK3_ARAVE|nr:hypothetical protein AVEN_217449-1 [Araneus ventricosus]